MKRITLKRTRCVPLTVIALLQICLVGCSDNSDGIALVEPVEAAAETGPFAVGHQRLEATDASRSNRMLPYDVWYPSNAADAAGGPPTIYPLQDPAGLTSELAVDDLPVALPGPYPFLVFSHGYGGTNTQSVRMMEHLASHGFIVVSAEHTGNTNDDNSDPFDEAGANRVPDVSFMIDLFLARNETVADDFHERIDGDAIGVLGHSFGGGTSMGSVAGYFGVEPDPRVKAVMPISASIDGNISEEQLGAVEEPVLLMGGTLDTAVPIETQAVAFDQLVNSEAVYQVDIEGATHTHFANICDIANWLIDAGLTEDLWPSIGAAALIGPYNEACAEGAYPIEEAHRLQNLYGAAFFRRHLLGEEEYDYYLQDSYADENEPDVMYRSRAAE